jgi:histone-arginine methyltransferase CARM1
MLSDQVRTNIYKQVTIKNASQSFTDKRVMDIGAGSGVLSFFACQAGATVVYAVEASSMAVKMQRFVGCCVRDSLNASWLREGRIKILHGMTPADAHTHY